jgi:8-oxo-dGTP diphosphatase
VPSDAVVAGILIERQRLLLCHRSPDRRWFPDVWDLPGGHVEATESLRAALARELQEEIGVEADAHDMSSAGTIALDDGALSLFLVGRWTGVPENVDPREHDRIGWFASDDLSALAMAHSSYRTLFDELLSEGEPGAN